MDLTLTCLYGFIVGMTLVAVLVGTLSERMLPSVSTYMKQRNEDDVMIFFNVSLAGTLLWPLLFVGVLGADIIRQCPWTLIGLLWPIAIGVLQMYDMYYDRCEDIRDNQEQRSHLIGGIHLDSSTVISFAFACATFFWAIGNVGNKANLMPSARIIMMALLLCIGFIVPTQHFLDNNQRYSIYVRVAQRVGVNCAMGLLITALIIVMTNCISQ